jgi:hypothetical protein
MSWFGIRTMIMSIDGFYAAYITGSSGQGFALLVFREGRIIGADALGGVFDGQYSEAIDDAISVKLTIKTPPNVPLIQGGITGPQGEETALEFPMPRDFASRQFVRIDGPRGPANVRLVKIRDIDG